MEDCRREALEQQLETCSSVEEIFDMISPEHKNYYFMEVSSLLHDDQTLYSRLLKKTMDITGITDYISAHNYEYLIKFVSEETQQYITQGLTQQRKEIMKLRSISMSKRDQVHRFFRYIDPFELSMSTA